MKITPEWVRRSFVDQRSVEHFASATLSGSVWASERHLIEQYLSRDQRILDIGCGTGRTTLGLVAIGYRRIVGVDYSEGMIERARGFAAEQALDVVFEVGDATSLQYANECFDAAIFSHNGLMTIPTAAARLRALKEIYRILLPGGIVLFSTHDRAYPPSWQSFWHEERLRWQTGQHDQRLSEFGDRLIDVDGVETFIHIPTRDSVAHSLAEAGFSVVEDRMRSDFALESEVILSTTSDCRLWVAARPVTVSPLVDSPA